SPRRVANSARSSVPCATGAASTRVDVSPHLMAKKRGHGVALLHRSDFRSLRWRAVLRSARGVAEKPPRPVALVRRAPPAWYQGEMAGLGAIALCRSP